MGGFQRSKEEVEVNDVVVGDRSIADLTSQESLATTGSTPLVLPVLSEELSVSKRQFVTGIVRIRKVVHEREEFFDQPVIQSKLEIERVPMNRVVEGPLPVRQDGETTIYSVVEEVLVVTKQYLLKEEVRVTQRVSEVASPQRILLRTEELVIEREQITDPVNVI